jgi:hypothetical protein
MVSRLDYRELRLKISNAPRCTTSVIERFAESALPKSAGQQRLAAGAAHPAVRHQDVLVGGLSGVHLHPGDVSVNPVLRELPAVWADLVACVEQTFLRLDESFGLAERRHVEIRKHVAQVLL